MSNKITFTPTVWNLGLPFGAVLAFLLVGKFVNSAIITGVPGMLFSYLLCAAVAFCYLRFAKEGGLENGALMGVGASAAILLVNAIGLFGAVEPLGMFWALLANVVTYGVVFAGFLVFSRNALPAVIAGASYALATYVGWTYLGTATLFPPSEFVYRYVIENAIIGACLGAAASEAGMRMKRSAASAVPAAFAAFGLFVYVLSIGGGMSLLLTLAKTEGILGALNLYLFAGPLKERLIAAAISFVLLFGSEHVRKTTAS